MSGFRGTQNKNGRPKGTQNKDTAQIRTSFQYLIENNLEQLESDLKELKPFERIKMILELSKFVVPHLKSMELINPNEEDKFKRVIINLGAGINPEEDEL